jgi:hypothetical protein
MGLRRRRGAMALSDRLGNLAQQAKEAEDKARRAADEAKSDLRSRVDHASELASRSAEKLAAQKAEGEARVSQRWAQVQSDWAAHVAKAREGMASKKAAADAKGAKIQADLAEADAGMAIDFAFAALEEAEYAVLDAILARKEADDLAMTQ